MDAAVVSLIAAEPGISILEAARQIVTVEQLLKNRQAKVDSFTLFVVDEGIEKKQDDFAAEVAAQVAAAR